MSDPVRIIDAGDRAVVVELGDTIDPEVNARVRRLAHAVAQRIGPDVVEVVPTYRSLLVLYDPLRVARGPLVERLGALAANLPATGSAEGPARTVHLPACYGGEFGPDLESVARHAGIEPDEVIAIHSGATYRVYMLGFTPGFGYLGGLPARIATPRLDNPRQRVPAGSVGIGGLQTGIYPIESPGGWRIVGRTPVRLFDPASAAPFLFAPGDQVRFEPITRAQFDEIAARVADGTFRPRVDTVEEAPA